MKKLLMSYHLIKSFSLSRYPSLEFQDSHSLVLLRTKGSCSTTYIIRTKVANSYSNKAFRFRAFLSWLLLPRTSKYSRYRLNLPKVMNHKQN